MKKVIFKIATLLFLLNISCTVDETTRNLDQNENSNVEVVYHQRLGSLKSDFELIVESQNFRSFLESANQFNAKLALDSDSNFLEESDLFFWLQNNIIQTNFSSYEEAVSKYDEIKENYSRVLESNNQFFISLNELSEEDRLEIISSVKNIYPISNQDEFELNPNFAPCIFGCINDAVSCNNAADQTYAQQLSVSAGLWAMGFLPAAAAAATLAAITHNSAVNACVRGLNTCKRNCND